MTIFFNSAKYDTLRRQLNIWGFTRIVKVRSPDIGCYFHEIFLRGQFDLCNTMVRSRSSEFMKMPGNQPDFEDMPIMPATVTLSIPHFADMAENLSSALCEDHNEKPSPLFPDYSSQSLSSDEDVTNSNSFFTQSKKRKQGIESSKIQSHNKTPLNPSFDSSVYPAHMNYDSLTRTLRIGSYNSDLPHVPFASLTKDACNEHSNVQNTFSNQEDFQTMKKANQVSVDPSLPVTNSILNAYTLNQANASSRQEVMIPTRDAMPIEQSLALAQMLFNQQQQVNNFNSISMISNSATFACTSTMEEIGNIQDSEMVSNSGSYGQATRTTSMPINNRSSTKSSDVASSTSCLSVSEKSLSVSEQLASCNSMVSMSVMNTDMKEKTKEDSLLDKKQEESNMVLDVTCIDKNHRNPMDHKHDARTIVDHAFM